jgi:RHS repeat-associated protein
MGIKNREYVAFKDFRYKFNGKETDSETGTQDYGMRIYDTRLGKFLSVDPMIGSYPFYTPYQFASNTPIVAIDIDGAESNIIMNSNETIIDTKEESLALIAAKYGRNAVERSNPSVYFQNKQNEAANESRAVLKVVNDGLIIAAGVTTVVLTAGAGAPIAVTLVGTLSGSFGAAAGSVKLVADLSGNYNASNNVPTSYFGGMTMMLEMSIGDEKHLVSGIVSLAEGVYTWNPTDVKSLTTTLQKAGYTLDAINNIVSGVQLTDQFIKEFFPEQQKSSQPDTKKMEKSNTTKLTNKEVDDIKKFLKTIDNSGGKKSPKQEKKTTAPPKKAKF